MEKAKLWNHGHEEFKEGSVRDELSLRENQAYLSNEKWSNFLRVLNWEEQEIEQPPKNYSTSIKKAGTCLMDIQMEGSPYLEPVRIVLADFQKI